MTSVFFILHRPYSPCMGHVWETEVKSNWYWNHTKWTNWIEEVSELPIARIPPIPNFLSLKWLNIYCKGRNCTAEAKAAKRALKKAKKEAQRKVMMSPRYLHSWSPSYLPSRSPCHLTSRSPSYLSSRSPSYLACRSPSYLSGRSPSSLLSRSPSQHRNFSPGQSPAQRGVHASPVR